MLDTIILSLKIFFGIVLVFGFTFGFLYFMAELIYREKTKTIITIMLSLLFLVSFLIALGLNDVF